MDAAQDSVLYVEGIAQADDELKVTWTGQGEDIDDRERVRTRVFTWLGPLNVPGYTRYRYTASGALPTSTWMDGNGGAIHSMQSPSDAEYLWGSGPVVGTARYQATPDFVWDLEVNVVQIEISATNNSASYPGLPLQEGGAGSAFIRSAPAGTNAMTAEIMIASVTGPSDGSTQRGRKFMEIGLVHQAELTGKHGLYNDSTPPMRIRSSLEDGLVHWDAASASTVPWVFVDSDHYLLISSDSQVVSNVIFSTFDNPGLLTTDQFVLSGDQVDVLSPMMDHQLYLGVRSTWPDVNGSADVLTQRARLAWTTDGEGSVNAAGVWSLTGSGVIGDPSFTQVTNGIPIPSAAPNLNEEFANQTWIVENQ